jgi:hypothetical protein
MPPASTMSPGRPVMNPAPSANGAIANTSRYCSGRPIALPAFTVSTATIS